MPILPNPLRLPELADLANCGLSAELVRSGHWKIRDAAGHYVATFPRTPSDYRSVRNACSTLRRRMADRA